LEKLKIYKKIKEIASMENYRKKSELERDLKNDLYLNNTKEDIKEVKDFIEVKIDDIKEKSSEEINTYMMDYEQTGDTRYLDKVLICKKMGEKEKEELRICENLYNDYKQYKELVLPKKIRVYSGNCKNENGNKLRKDRYLEKGKKMLLVKSFFNNNGFNHGEAYTLLDPKTNYTYNVMYYHLKL
jgi:hypothetical protein